MTKTNQSSLGSDNSPAGDAAADMGMRNKAGPFGRVLIDEALHRPDIVAVTADLSKYTDLFAFEAMFPDRFLNVGMAEQNLVNVACGMAMGGLTPVATTFGAFLTRRAADFIVMQAALPKLNVKLIGAVPGITATFGPSHTSTDDIAAIRAIPNMVIIDPADGEELGSALKAALEYDGPVYLRQPFATHMGDASLRSAETQFKIGESKILRPGKDVGIIAAGFMIDEALTAAKLLAEQGVDAGVLSASCIKPFDSTTLLNFANGKTGLVTAENHSVVGGVGSIVCETLAREGMPMHVRSLGVPDNKFPPFGSREFVQRELGMEPEHIAAAAMSLLERH